MMNDSGKSDGFVVPAKPRNKAGHPAADAVEERSPTKGNTPQATTHRTQRRARVSSDLMRVREAARRDRKMRFTALLHHVTIDRLRESFLGLSRDAAPGADGVTWNMYKRELEVNLENLHARVHRGAYRARPTRRVFIPKADGRLRPLGIAALEDKVVQGAVAEVMNAIYEVDFLGFSYGFRQGRSQHDALDALSVALRKKVSWVLDADIRGFFDELDHGWLMKFIEHRIADKRLLRLLRKWLKAGVMEQGKRVATERGTPQGATISPLLANIYLHYALDLWVQQWRNRPARGDMVIVRYADDFVLGFQHQRDAKEFVRNLQDRLQRFRLELHPTKTRLLEFGRFATRSRARRGAGKPESFNFLGFTHYCGTTQAGWFRVHRQPMRERMRERLRTIKIALFRRRHLPIPVQGAWLARVLRGYFAYFAVPGTVHLLGRFRSEVEHLWRRALSRRSQRGGIIWARMRRLSDRWLPKARILHLWPDQRFNARTRGRSPVR